MYDALKTARNALETAADKILDDYRTWVADNTEAKPRYGQIPEYDAVNAAVRECEDALLAAPTVAAQQCGRDAAALVERLREDAEYIDIYDGFVGSADRIARNQVEAASLIQSQAARITELEEGLKPFIGMAGEMFARGWNASDVVIALDNPNDPHRVTAGDFFTARSLLNGERKG